jgi:hypothetical protein
MCSIFEDKLYPFSGNEPRGKNMVNVPLPTRSGGDAFRAAATEKWLRALEASKPEVIFISAGFDATAKMTWVTSAWSRQTITGSRSASSKSRDTTPRDPSCPALKAAMDCHRCHAELPRT